MNEVKEGKNIPTVENSLCKALEAEKSMEGLRKARVAAVQRAGPHEAEEVNLGLCCILQLGVIVTTVYSWNSVP